MTQLNRDAMYGEGGPPGQDDDPVEPKTEQEPQQPPAQPEPDQESGSES